MKNRHENWVMGDKELEQHSDAELIKEKKTNVREKDQAEHHSDRDERQRLKQE